MDEASRLALVPKISGSISILCSLYILNEVRIDYRSRRLPITAVTRAVVGMSILVILVGFSWGASNWMVPAEEADHGGRLTPMGNRWTCQLQGFFLQYAVGPPLYNAAILWFAQRSIFHNENSVPLFLEILIHVGIVIWCSCSSTLLLLKDKFHSIGPVCWASDAPDCDEDDSCNVKVYSLVLYCIPLWLALAYTVASCVRIRHFVRQNHADSKKVTQRADSLVALYSVAIFITYFPCTIWSFTYWNDNSPNGLLWLYALLEPLQGIWNLVIFFMNRRPAARARLRKTFVSICCLFQIKRSGDFVGNDDDGDDDDDKTSSTDQHHRGQTIIPVISMESRA